MESFKIIKEKYYFPNFFCIGVKRGGTTWLYEAFKSHPQIYLCPFNKETHFFSVYYHRDFSWYKKFFPKKQKVKKYKVIGEIAPTYITCKEAPKRISKIFPNAKFIVIFRDPVERAISDYKYELLNFNLNWTFEEYLLRKPINKYDTANVIERGFYAKQIKNWLNYFPKENFLILIFEKVMKQKSLALKEISKFLNISQDFHINPNIKSRINPSSIPKFHKLYLLSLKTYEFLQFYSQYKVLEILRKFKPFLFILNEKKMNWDIKVNLKDELYEQYITDIKELEKLFGINLDVWKKKSIYKNTHN